MTNADKIRALPNEAMAYILRQCCIGAGCEDCPLTKFCGEFRGYAEWLESEAEG